MQTLDKILTPLTVGSTVLANRMVMGAMHTRLETLDRPMNDLQRSTRPGLRAKSA